MKHFTLLFLIFLSSSLFSWNSLGPTGYNTNYYLCANAEILCTNSGLLIYDWEDDEWEEYSNGMLPIWNAIPYSIDEIIVIMGDGSYSDGVWFFNLETKEFTIIEWLINPNFIFQTSLGYYVGHSNGLIFSEDLSNWESITTLNGYDCVDIAQNGNNLVVATNNLFFHSPDDGVNWYSQSIGPLISRITFDHEGKLWGIFPSISNSSGLYSSDNFGENWEVQMWSIGMSSLFRVENSIYISWIDDFGEGNGVARWNPISHQPDFLNDGLLNLNINRLTTNDQVDCYNLVACTQNGAFIEFDLEVNIDEEEIHPITNLKNYPNPFSDKTTFSIDIPRNETTDYTLKIYNIKGELIETLDYNLAPIWIPKDIPNGIYLTKLLKYGNEIDNKKITLIK